VSVKSIELETKLIERAVEKRNALIAQAKEKADRIINSAEEEVERIRVESEKQILSLVGSELRAVNDRIVGRAHLEGRKMLMHSRQELLSTVFDEAEKTLRETAEEEGTDYGEILMKLVVESATAIGGDEFKEGSHRGHGNAGRKPPRYHGGRRRQEQGRHKDLPQHPGGEA
jgi:vacuolar-type H+-ATPase subunit E/Vma4